MRMELPILESMPRSIRANSPGEVKWNEFWIRHSGSNWYRNCFEFRIYVSKWNHFYLSCKIVHGNWWLIGLVNQQRVLIGGLRGCSDGLYRWFWMIWNCRVKNLLKWIIHTVLVRWLQNDLSCTAHFYGRSKAIHF